MKDGILIIYKEKNMTSFDVVRKVRYIVNEKKVGHTGTLDPNATGVLPLLIGDATKLSQDLINHDKEYNVALLLGKKTTTADEEGEIVEERKVPDNAYDKENVEKVLTSFKGKQKQIPPMYSAIKVNGKKLYELARQGKTIDRTSRDIEIYDINLERISKKENTIFFHVSCSKGTYIRSLCEDIAQKLRNLPDI